MTMTTIASDGKLAVAAVDVVFEAGVTDRGQGERGENRPRYLMAFLSRFSMSAIWVIDTRRKGVLHLNGLLRFTGNRFHSE